ncbi:hypothetical protein B0H10DRAFT_881171 [Mycena sp. CBHHK59/15]|nr:hypothetical protein B0H10DRAFT_881171 [Mycena sp. CBHHK59/15]
MDVEMEVQPAHRAEALDVLAGIELKYALLREAVYVERMEGLGWEETLVLTGTHPEMLHIQRELSARRDKRIELATRKRSFEHADAERKRRVGEDGVWSWWKLARDELQTDMISEQIANDGSLNASAGELSDHSQCAASHPATTSQRAAAPPSLRRIIKSVLPFGRPQQRHTRTRHGHTNGVRQPHVQPRLVFPDLTPLSANDIQSDLDFMLQHQHQPHQHSVPHVQHPSAHALPGHGHGHVLPPPPPQVQAPIPSRSGIASVSVQQQQQRMSGMMGIGMGMPPPPQAPQQQPMYDSFAGGRVPPPQQQQQFQHGPPPPQQMPPGFPPPNFGRAHHGHIDMNPYAFAPGGRGRADSPVVPGKPWFKGAGPEWGGGPGGEGRVIGMGMPMVRPVGRLLWRMMSGSANGNASRGLCVIGSVSVSARRGRGRSARGSANGNGNGNATFWSSTAAIAT